MQVSMKIRGNETKGVTKISSYTITLGTTTIA
jgi:hypothetical protein